MLDGTWQRAQGVPGAGARIARTIQATAILATAGLLLYHLAIAAASFSAAGARFALLGLALGVLAADLLTGAVHWACDTWGHESTPWIGASVIRSFHAHHRDPRAMVAHDWIEVNGQPALGACPLLALTALPALTPWLAAHPAIHAGCISLVGVTALANQLHQWAHRDCAPPGVRALQRWGWVLSPTRHRLHHTAPHTSDYCISSGWLNRPLDALGFWRALERAITRLTGVRPRAAAGSRATTR